MIKGHCLCGEIAYTYHGDLEDVVICHCNQCKRAQGTPFASNAPIQSASFQLEKGMDFIASYFSSPAKQRVFCKQCGSPLYSKRNDKPEVLRLRLGTVTEGYIPKPSYEIYGASKADWLDCDADRPVYEANTPSS